MKEPLEYLIVRFSPDGKLVSKISLDKKLVYGDMEARYW